MITRSSKERFNLRKDHLTKLMTWTSISLPLRTK